MTAHEDTIKISVIIPAYNNDRWIGRAIESVLGQSRPAEEVIVVDDGSTDRTGEIVRGYGEKVRYIRQENAGPSAARNAGIAAASCEWIAFLDGDDEWLPEKLARQVEVLRSNPDLVWVMGNYYECLCEEKRKAEQASVNKIRKLTGENEKIDYFQACRHSLWGHMDVLLARRDVLNEAGLFAEQMKVGEDIDLWLRIAYRHPKAGFCSQPLAVHHLEVSQSIMKRCRLEIDHSAFIERHRKLAEEHGAEKAFRSCAGAMIRRWTRSLLFEGRSEEIRNMLSISGGLVNPAYRLLIQILICFPGLTSGTLKGISRAVRFLKLRRKAVRRPWDVTK